MKHRVTETVVFGPISVTFDDKVLRPRPWTLAQSTWAAELAGTVPAGRILELCCGAGQIGIAAAVNASRGLVLIDADATACQYAAANAAAAGISARVEVRCGSMDVALEAAEVFPLILADPPWVCSADTTRFPDDPLLAIDGGPDGLDLARSCVENIGRHLGSDGAAVLQLRDEDQAARIQAHLVQRPQIGLRLSEVRTSAPHGCLAKLTRPTTPT